MNDFDPDAFLKGAPATPETAVKAEKPTSDFDPDAFLSATQTEQPQQKYNAPNAIQSAVQTAAPATYVSGPTGLPELAKDVGQNFLKPAVQGLGTYAKNPLNVLADIGLAHAGVPPGAIAAKKMYDAYKTAHQVVGGLNDMLSKLPAGTAEAARPFIEELRPADVTKLSDAIKANGLDKAIKEFQIPEYLGKEAVDSFGALKGAIPTVGQKVMGVAGPILRGASKIAGPAGLAMNAYDAAQYAQAAELGKRLANGQGGIAQQTFRNVQHNIGSQYQLQPQEAANVLASGDAATINLYGGPERLNQIAGGQSPSAPPTSTNFVERMKAMAHQYGMIK
jgi:hypothetical protein